MRILIIPDTHAPYSHPDALDFLADLAKEIKPQEVVHLGDEADFHSFSTHPREPECYGPDDELRLAGEFIKDLGKLFPRMKLCYSNHVARLQKAAARSNLPSRTLKPWRDIINAPRGWQWAAEWRNGLGFRAFHGDGYLGKGAIEAAVVDSGSHVVFGHLHSIASVEYYRRAGWQHWGMCAGCLVDPDSPAMRYAGTHRKKPVLGAAAVVDGVPWFRGMRL